jgi:hypothetical protein
MSEPRLVIWKKASESYEQLKKAASFDTEAADILFFIQSGYWLPALKLLEASGQDIQIGFAEGSHSDVGYFLGHNGFFEKLNQEKTSVSNLVMFDTSTATSEKLKEFAKAFRNQNPKIMFQDFIYGKLDEIANNSPKPEK